MSPPRWSPTPHPPFRIDLLRVPSNVTSFGEGREESCGAPLGVTQERKKGLGPFETSPLRPPISEFPPTLPFRGRTSKTSVTVEAGVRRGADGGSLPLNTPIYKSCTAPFLPPSPRPLSFSLFFSLCLRVAVSLSLFLSIFIIIFLWVSAFRPLYLSLSLS